MLRSLSLICIFFTTIPAAAVEKAPLKPLSPTETVQRMQLPPGFKATVFAAEPDVVQPMAMTFDDRGRLWVVECFSYPDWTTPKNYRDPTIAKKSSRKRQRPGKSKKQKTPGAKTSGADAAGSPSGHDRITIFEDTNGDGEHDKRTVFYDKGVNFTGIEYGYGGVFVTAPPYLLFMPDKNQDDKPDGPPQILLDGWDLKAKHNVVNGLTWGPDGWLYGLNGILSNSNVGVVKSRARQEADNANGKQSGKPLPDGRGSSKRTKMNCGVWRYHPTRRVFEVVAHGTTNPWGLDFNADGEMFITNCVIKHLFHVIPGAHYKRMYGQDITPNVYGLMESCADHIHWGGGKWSTSRGGHGKHDKPGGGHAHVGCMIYLGDNWPKKYRGKVFTCNVHGKRVNMDILKHKGSGYVASHGADFLKIPDPWFRGLEMKYGPDGGVYLTDWSDIGECHDRDSIHRENGRIYKITYGKAKPWKGDLAKLKDGALLGLLSHKNRWFARHARRLIHERATSGKLDSREITYFEGEMFSALRPFQRSYPILDFLWTMHLTDKKDRGPNGPWKNANDLNSAWSIRLALEDGKVSPKEQQQLVAMARNDKSPRVRLALASGLQRLPIKARWAIAEALVAHAVDAKDANIPLMIWYGIEPAIAADKVRAIQLLRKTKIPLIRQYIARRLAESAQ